MAKLSALALSFHLLIYYNFVFYRRTRWLSWSACVGVVEPVCVCVSEWVLLDMSRVLLTLRYYATLPSATPYVIALSSSCSPSPAAFCDMCRIHIPCILPKLNGSRNCCHGLNAVWLCQPANQSVQLSDSATPSPSASPTAWLNVVIVFFLIWSLIIAMQRVYTLQTEQESRFFICCLCFLHMLLFNLV